MGTVELVSDEWRASFRLQVPGEFFSRPGGIEFFATEMQATRWLHTEATARGCAAIEIKRVSSQSQLRSESRGFSF